uniref:Polypyrimidine tract-binding protein homolog 2-like isoform X3 n=1 Tax=Nicotiana sylvestris TaxID=4096 RepID=A0A1U7X9C8_NICSY|nr:PREDICTED: polypyrimidine tract-binding protein homolog 2-like isoform X3 [Nicotiana sylvestris]XP_009788717.1 PREDICTED: polypyrimidine tract-binding protein homolog 2-like isoform X3 [Nicotiana sylvestris]
MCFQLLDLCTKSQHLRRQLDSRLWCNFLMQKPLLQQRMPWMEEAFPGDVGLYFGWVKDHFCRCGAYTLGLDIFEELFKNLLKGYLIPELGPCTLKITYSAHTDLSVKFQSHRSRDYTNPHLPVAPSAIDASGQFSLGLDGKKLEPESNVLLASIENMQYAVTLDVLHTVFSAFGPVLKIAMFDKNGGVQALIQYPDVRTAVVAKGALEGHSIYEGGYCKLHITYSRHTDLSIKVNNDRSRDYTIPNTPMLNSQPSIFGQQPPQIGGPGVHPYSAPAHYAPAPGVAPPQHSAGWNSAAATANPGMPMQMHNHPYMPPGSVPSQMGSAVIPMHGRNGIPYSTAMPPYHQQ